MGGLLLSGTRGSLVDRMSHRFTTVLEQVRNAFATEELPPPPPDEGWPAPRAPGLAALLFGREQLPVDPERPRSARRGILATLFAPEPLPFEPASAPRRHARWLAWLFLPERIDRDPNRPEVH